MKLDFDQLKQMALKFNQDYLEDGNLCENMDKGAHVYTISFDPREARVRVHLQWPYFRNQVANEADHPATYYKMDDDTLHLACDSHGVEISTILNKSEVVFMLKELVAEHPESDYEVCEDDDILAMSIIWQNMTGWDLDWPEEVVVYD